MLHSLLIAHRGTSEIAPENTLPAFQKAMEQSCRGIEFDVQLSRDGIPVIIHDEAINRTSNGTGFVKDLTLADLKSFDFGSYFDPSYRNIRIPTLEEFFRLAAAQNYGGLVNIELKTDKFTYAGIESKTLAIAEQYDFSKQVVFSSFNHQTLANLRALSPSVKLSVLYERGETADLQTLQSLQAFSCNVHYADINKSMVDKLHKNNFQVFCYTVNHSNTIKFMSNLGVDGIFTNHPSKHMKVLEAQKESKNEVSSFQRGLEPGLS